MRNYVTLIARILSKNDDSVGATCDCFHPWTKVGLSTPRENRNWMENSIFRGFLIRKNQMQWMGQYPLPAHCPQYRWRKHIVHPLPSHCQKNIKRAMCLSWQWQPERRINRTLPRPATLLVSITWVKTLVTRFLFESIFWTNIDLLRAQLTVLFQRRFYSLTACNRFFIRSQQNSPAKHFMFHLQGLPQIRALQ